MFEDHPTIALFRKSLEIPSPPGREERFADFVRREVEKIGYTHETDPAGNVLVRLEGEKEGAGLVVYSAHMDEIGMVVTRVHEDGTLRVDKSGGLYPWKIGEAPVEILGDREIIPGLLSMGSIHARRVADRKTVEWKDVRVITGLSCERLSAAGVRSGSSVVLSCDFRGPVFLGEGDDPLVAAWTFDDRIDVVNLLRILEELKAGGTRPVRRSVFAFTVQEENGCHGAKYVSRRLEPELFVAVDGCPVLEELDLSLDGRPGIWSKDAVTHFDQEVVRAFIRCAEEVGTEIVPAVFDGAASDASMAYSTGAVARAVTVGHIRDNSHGFEVARLSSIENARKVLLRFAETWG